MKHIEKWAAEFNRGGGEEIVEDDGWSGHPKYATTDVKGVHTLLMCDGRQGLRSIASKVGIRLGAVQLILTDILGM